MCEKTYYAIYMKCPNPRVVMHNLLGIERREGTGRGHARRCHVQPNTPRERVWQSHQSAERAMKQTRQRSVPSALLLLHDGSGTQQSLILHPLPLLDPLDSFPDRLNRDAPDLFERLDQLATVVGIQHLVV